jgi:type I restriction enzyme, S subunit
VTLRVHPDQIVAESDSPLLKIAPWWERTRLADVANVTNGAAFSSSHFNNESRGLPLIRIRDVGSSSASIHYDGNYDERDLVERSDLIIGMDGDFRIARWTGPTSLLNQRVCRVTVIDEALYDDRFLQHCVQPYLDAVHRHTSSVTVKHLSSRTVEALPIPLPPRAEQERIVAAIEAHYSRLDTAGGLLIRALRRLDQVIAASRATAMGTAETLVPLGSLASTQLGKMLSKKSKTGISSTPYVRNKNVRWGAVDISDLAEMDFNKDEIERFRLRAGDVLICEGGAGVGRTGIWRGELDLCCYQKAVHRVRPGPDLIPQFLVEYMRYLVESKRLERYLSGVAIGHLPQEDLRALPMPALSASKQIVIMERLDRYASIAEVLRRHAAAALRRSASLRRSVLAAAFSGRLIPQDPKDEPATLLLERIRAERATAESRRRSRTAS